MLVSGGAKGDHRGACGMCFVCKMTCERMKMHDSMRTDACPRCNEEIEDWKHLLRCKCNGIKVKFLTSLKNKLTDIKNFQMQSMTMMEKMHNFIKKLMLEPKVVVLVIGKLKVLKE